jgi:hypothetical protein
LPSDAAPEPTTEPTAEPEPVAVDKTQALLVVNATTKAGYAGQIAKLVEDAEFESVAASNAKGIYEEGHYLLVPTIDAAAQALLTELQTATKLSITLQEDASAEDSQDKYAAVLVLAK